MKRNPTFPGLALAVMLTVVSVPVAGVAARLQEIPLAGSTPGLGGVRLAEQAAKGEIDRRAQPHGLGWVRAGMNTDRATWGFRGGLLWGLPPRNGRTDGPRGLIRLRYPVLPNGNDDLINFIAIEPVVQGRRGFSELEWSGLDCVRGKRLSAQDPETPVGPTTTLPAGRLTRLDTGAECLTVYVAVERFENGAHVGLTLSQRSDAPDELELTVHREPDSAPIEYCILTATMGNKARTRQLWLRNEVARSLDLWPNYQETGFTPHRLFSLDRLHRTSAGDFLAAITTNEADPAAVDPFPAAPHWRYAGFPVTQYWKKPQGTWRDDLHVAVNGRYTYWLSRQPIPGGVAFENFEMREHFHEGQRFVFGITRESPQELGLATPPQEHSSNVPTLLSRPATEDGVTESGGGTHFAAEDPFVYQDGAVVRGSTSTRQLALVFSGHEYADGAGAILEALALHATKASFFLTGDFLRNAEFAPLIRRVLAEGHYVGPHSDRHRLYCAWTPDRRTLLTRAEFEADLNGNLRELERFGVTRLQARFFLPAYEHHNRDISDWTQMMGVTLLNLSPGTRSAADYTAEKDPNFLSSQAILDSILRRESQDPAGLNGFVLLLHLGSGPERADKMHLRLPELLSRLKERGYAFERIDRLLGRHLRASQVGYTPQGPKLAVTFASEPLPKRFEVIELDSGRSVFQGATRPVVGTNWGRFNHVAELDFSALRRSGRFRLRLGGAVSLPIVVHDAVFQPLPDLLLEFMRQQRCGFNPWLNAHCHQLDGRTAYGALAAGTAIDVRGGWHDAADLLKYLLTSSNATAQMLLAWEMHRRTPEQSSSPLFDDRCDALGRSGANGLPDLLDEARWGLEWMLKLHPAPDQLYHQVADDRDHCGWRLPQDEHADYGWGKGSHRVVYGADGRPQGLGCYQSESTGLANLAGRYAAAMALAFQVWKDDTDQAAFARRCLTAAEEVYQLGRGREGVQQGNSYGAPYRYAETTWADDMEWGAAELFRATGNRRYLDDARRYARLAGSESWMGREQTGHYQYYPFFNAGHFRLHGVADAEFQKLLEGWYHEGIERCRAASEKNPFGIGVPFIWCSNNLVVALVTQCLLYENMSGDGRYREFAARHRDWLLGRNPWGTTQFMGVGTVSPGNVHLMTTRLTGRALRGGLVDGPVYERIFKSLKGVSITEPDPLAEFQDPRAVYHDDLQDYASNEPTMDGTASAILMWAALQAIPPHPGNMRSR